MQIYGGAGFLGGAGHSKVGPAYQLLGSPARSRAAGFLEVAKHLCLQCAESHEAPLFNLA